jgi:outer membrane protein TolC
MKSICVFLLAWTGMISVATAEPAMELPEFYANDGQLESLIETLLAENPQIRAAAAMLDASRERAPQARSLPDPTLSLRVFGGTPETRVGPQEQALEFSQRVPWFNKRALQAERADYSASGIAWHVRDLQYELVADLKRAWFESAYLQEALEVNDEERSLLKRFEQTTLTRYATGQGNQQSVIKVQTDISRLDDREAMLQERLRVEERKIARLIGRPEAVNTLQPISLQLLTEDFQSLEMETEALEIHPRVRAWQQQIEADRVWSRRKALDTRPDFRFGVGYTLVGGRADLAGQMNPPEDNGQDIWAVTVGVNLPIYRRRIRAAVAEAEAGVRSSELQLEQSKDRLRYGIQEALVRVQSRSERLRLYRELIIPQAEQSLASAETAYTNNRQDFLDLLDAQRVLFQARLTTHRLMADYWVAMADLERGLGRAFPAGDDKS